jgi:hypothetical protein
MHVVVKLLLFLKIYSKLFSEMAFLLHALGHFLMSSKESRPRSPDFKEE